MSVVYFAEAVGAGTVKIGWTELPVRSRLASVQSSCPHPLKLLVAVAGDRATEAAYHAQFAAKRVAGEWFRLDDEMRAFVATLHPADEPQRVVRRNDAARGDARLKEFSETLDGLLSLPALLDNLRAEVRLLRAEVDAKLVCAGLSPKPARRP